MIRPVHIWFLAAITFGYVGCAVVTKEKKPPPAKEAPKENPNVTRLAELAGYVH